MDPFSYPAKPKLPPLPIASSALLSEIKALGLMINAAVPCGFKSATGLSVPTPTFPSVDRHYIFIIIPSITITTQEMHLEAFQNYHQRLP